MGLRAGLDRVEVLLDVGIAITISISIGIRRIVSVQANPQLPEVGHAVAIAIRWWRVLLEHRPPTDLPLGVDDSPAPLLDLGRDARGDGIAAWPARPRFCEDPVEGDLRRFGRNRLNLEFM